MRVQERFRCVGRWVNNLRRSTEAGCDSLFFKMPLPLEGGEGEAKMAEGPE
jgi:hypothetical protein